MAVGDSPFQVVRPEDLLVLRVSVANLALSADGAVLERVDPAAPATITLSLPPQHVAERAFLEFADHVEAADPPPVVAFSAGPTRLAFTLREGELSVPFTVAGLLGWSGLDARLAGNALPVGRGGGGGPAPAVPGDDVTAIEFPYRMITSPLPGARWEHRDAPFAPGGWAELWHTRLLPEGTGSDEPTVAVRAVGVRAVPDVARTSLELRDLTDVALLSADFSVRPKSMGELRIGFARWRGLMTAARLLGRPFTPEPLWAERFLLSGLGGSVRMRGHFDYPLPDQSLDALTRLGMPTPSLLEYEHVAGQGRDQFVRVVRRGILCTGQRATIIKITERRFEPLLLTPPGVAPAEFGQRGVLRQYYQIVVTEPVIDYAALAGAYEHAGREMPLRSFRLTTLVTPKLDLVDPVTNIPIDADALERDARLVFFAVHRRGPNRDEERALLADVQKEVSDKLLQPFWIRAAGTEVLFDFVGTDWEGRPVTGSLPLVFVPFETVTKRDAALAAVTARYNGAAESLRRVALHGQLVALADPGGAAPGSTASPTDALIFEVVPLANPAGTTATYQATWLFALAAAEPHLESVERMTGQSTASRVTLHPRYLAVGLAAAGNPSGAYASLATAVALTVPADRAGGVARPDMALSVVSARQGPIPAAYALPAAVPRSELEKAFGGAKLFGTFALTDLIKPIPLLGAEHFAVADSGADPDELLGNDETIAVPILRSRRVTVHGQPAVETRYLWKPPLEVKDPTFQPAFAVDGARLVLQARFVAPADGSPPTAELYGELRNFDLSFFSVVVLHMDQLVFRSRPGRKPDLSAEGVSLRFTGDLEFVNTLRDLLPAAGFSDPPAIEITPTGVTAGFSLGIPTVGVGVFSLQNLALSAKLSLPFDERPAGLRFALSERHSPFLVTVTLFGGGGFFALGVSAKGVEEIEASIEFGGSVALNLGVASGGVYVMAGVYFAKIGAAAKLTGYLRCGGYLSVLGIVSISVEFYLSFTFASSPAGSEVWGQASVTVSVKVCGISKSVSLSVEKRFAGSAADPALDQVLSPDDWVAYCGAYAVEA